MRSKALFVFKALVVGCFLMFVACGKNGNAQSAQSTVIQQDLVGRMTALEWSIGCTCLAPITSYQVDFQLRKLVIASVNQATQASTIISSKALSDSQLSQIRSLVAGISIQSCAGTKDIAVGGIDDLSISTTSLSSSDMNISNAQCTSDDSKAYKGDAAGYEKVTNYLKSI
jgi:hypothetical protein